jgi:hypothetical protein
LGKYGIRISTGTQAMLNTFKFIIISHPTNSALCSLRYWSSLKITYQKYVINNSAVKQVMEWNICIMTLCGVTPCPSAPSPSPLYTVNTILNEITSQTMSYGQPEFDTYLGFFTVDHFRQQYIYIHISSQFYRRLFSSLYYFGLKRVTLIKSCNKTVSLFAIHQTVITWPHHGGWDGRALHHAWRR